MAQVMRAFMRMCLCLSSQRSTRAPVVQVHPRQEAGALLLVDGMALPLHPRLGHPARRSFWGLIRAFIH